MNVKDLDAVLYPVEMAICSLALFFHLLGLFALYLYKKQTNQKIILISLSFSEFMIALSHIPFRSRNILPYLAHEARIVIVVVHRIGRSGVLIAMYLLTTDRMICFINPLKYKLRVTRKRLYTTIFVCFSIAVALSVPYYLHQKTQLILNFIDIGFNFCYILLAISTYSVFFWKLRRRAEDLGQSTQRQDTNPIKQFVVPGVIILTYFLFYSVPTTFYFLHDPSLFKSQQDKVFAYKVILITVPIILFGIVADPLTYIFLSEQYRGALVACFRRRQRNDIETAL